MTQYISKGRPWSQVARLQATGNKDENNLTGVANITCGQVSADRDLTAQSILNASIVTAAYKIILSQGLHKENHATGSEMC